MKSIRKTDLAFIDQIANQYCRNGNCVGTIYDKDLDKFVPSKYWCCTFSDGGQCPHLISGDCLNNVPFPCSFYFCGEVLVRLSKKERNRIKRIQDLTDYFYFPAFCEKCGGPHVRYVKEHNKFICYDCK